MECYDIDNNHEIKWSEFYIGNTVKKSDKPTHRAVFQFFDKNHDWKVTKKEITKARINMYGQVDSLNVATAATLVLFEAVRQRQEAGILAK